VDVYQQRSNHKRGYSRAQQIHGSIVPYALEVCGLPICLGIDDVFNYTSLSSASVPPTPADYNDVTGLGVPYAPKLIHEG